MFGVVCRNPAGSLVLKATAGSSSADPRELGVKLYDVAFGSRTPSTFSPLAVPLAAVSNATVRADTEQKRQQPDSDER